MDADHQIFITLSGEGPWGFRLQGGSEKKLPLLVSKVRRRSKACRVGLREKDEVLSINGKPCSGISHVAAMQLIDSAIGRLQICVKRATAAATSRDQQALLFPTPEVQTLKQKPLQNPTGPDQLGLLHRETITSPPDSEAYYGETDSDADTLGQSSQELTQTPQEKHRRARKKSPRSPPDPQSMPEMSGYDSAPEPVRSLHYKEVVEAAPKSFQAYAPWRSAAKQQHHPATDNSQNLIILGEGGGGVAKREIVYQPSVDSRAETPFSDAEGGFYPTELEEGPAPSPEDLLLPQGMVRTIRAERPLIPMVGPVEHPVDDDLTTSYVEKAKQAMLHRSESVQEKQVKEAKTKCRTIASLLTDAPNPHSKGVLMFKKRRQRAKKYTLVSYGSVDEDRCEDEDGMFPTSESEFDEEGFSDARSLTNQSDWDHTYLDIEKSKMEAQSQQAEQSNASGRGTKMNELLRPKTGQSSAEQTLKQMPEGHQSQPYMSQTHMMMNGEGPLPQTPNSIQVLGDDANQADTSAIFNRSARPFTPGIGGNLPKTTAVIFRPSALKKKIEHPSGQSICPPPLPVAPSGTAIATKGTQMTSSSTKTSLYNPGPSKLTVALTKELSIEEIGLEKTNHPPMARATTASVYLSNPSRELGAQAAASQPTLTRSPESTSVTPGTCSTSLFISASPSSNSMSDSIPYTSVSQPFISATAPLQPTSESMASREQRISVPAFRTGILQEARKRGTRKQMFSKVEEKQKHSPNPELLSLVQNLDGKSKHELSGAGFESGPEEDFLSLGAEACNFMQSPHRRFKTPPPVAPKPHSQYPGSRLINEIYDTPQMGGKGAELFAKRQSRMDKFVVESTPAPSSRPRTPSPTPSLPSCWKYSPNIRAPPPIAYNPLHSPFYPLAASRSQSGKAESKVRKTQNQKPRIQAIDFMSHQPYQLNPAMFCYGGSPNATRPNPANQMNQQSSLSLTPVRQVPVKTVRTYEIKRFSTPTPMSSSTSLMPVVIKPRSATTLNEPIWRTEETYPPVPSRIPPPTQIHPPEQECLPLKSSLEFRTVGAYNPSSPITSPQSCISVIQVARPHFSAARTGIQANVWRPASVNY
ncbi:synaptopodin 2-like protein isoform X1 [Pleurodeles waltl]|uniref:synaptopodin 2-like protein isoform X1 n=1 Tax=Pleurodeles waltl TaxID=8319 RepID=UPI0037097F8B